ncbi:ABC transporter permease [Aeromicrobium endophyticum]|uniref:ABC transporter permease n=1 Tax=Aeromicrobium endophyticum TaxID=2292704 RepID=A0A371P9N8_9ACTN|nr:ABC transporter permease [Aeromicrobium endophyticum]REK72248.1 ABC transporter permease [Aeromicrobium endophyticum]
MKSAITSLNRELRAVWMLLFVCVVLFIATPLFLTGDNLLNVLLATSVTALLAAGQTYVIILAEIDLSVGAILGISSIVTAFVLRDQPLVVGLLAGWGVGAVAGLVNGLLVTKLRMPSFIATLAMMSVLAGLTLQFSQGNPVSIDNGGFIDIGQSRVLGVPTPVWIMLASFVVFGVLLARSRFGRHVYAVGDNADAARLAGINVHRVKILAFVISGVLSATAGFILAARLGTAQPTAGTGLELAAIAAVIIGGTSLAGGRGALAGTLIGALLLGVIDNGLNLLDVSPFLQGVVKGLVILIAIFLDRNSDRVRALARLVRPPRGPGSGTHASTATTSPTTTGGTP